MFNNSQKSGKGLKSMALLSLALFVSQGSAKNLNSLQALRDRVPGASHQVKQVIQEMKISSSDPLLKENNDYFEWAEYALNALQGLSEQEIKELQEEVPELKQLNGPSPFDRNKVTAVIDDASGHEFSEKDLQELLEFNKIMTEKYEQQAQRSESKKGSKHHRNLAAAGSTYGSPDQRIVQMLKSVDPVIWRLIDSYKNMEDYDLANQSIKDAIDEIPEQKVNVEMAKEMKATSSKKLYSAYRWLKTSSRVLYKLLLKVQKTAIEQGDMYDADDFGEEVGSALDKFGLGVSKSEKYIGEANDFSAQSRNKCSLVKNALTEKKNDAWDNVQGKSKEYDDFAELHRGLAYGTCAAVCAGTAVLTFGTSCAACYGIAAGVLETKLKEFRDKNRDLMNKYKNMEKDVQVVLDDVMEIISGLNSLDGDIKGVNKLIKDSRAVYNDIKETDVLFLTMEAGEEDGTFTEFLEVLERTLNYDKNVGKCGTPDCSQSCMVKPLFNESQDYEGCWNQSYRGNKCKNWLEAGAKEDASRGIGNHSSCRNPDPSKYAQAWCYIEDPLDSAKTWEYCVDPSADPLV